MTTTEATQFTTKSRKSYPGWLKWLLLLYLPFLLLTTGLALLIGYQQPSIFHYDFNAPDQPLIEAPLYGFYPPERNHGAGSAFSNSNFGINAPYVASADYELTLQTFGGLLGNANKSWLIKINGVPLTTFVPVADTVPHTYTFAIPATLLRDSHLDVLFSGTALRPSGDWRTLGINVSAIELKAVSLGWVWPPLKVYPVSLLLALLFAMLVLPFWFGFGFPARSRLNQTVILLVLGVAPLYLFLSRWFAPATFGRDLDNLNYGIGRIMLGEYTILGLVWLVQRWLNWRKGRLPQAASVESLNAFQPATAALTGLRYFAALLVFFNHMPIDSQIPTAFFYFFRSGYVGVSLFFSLSGFVLCYNYFEAMSQRLQGSVLRSFWVARFARVYPMYALGSLLALPLVQPDRNYDAIPYQLLLVQSFSPDKNILLSFNSVAWSVSVEAFFYLTFPFIVYFGLRFLRRTWQIFLTGGLLVLAQLAVESYTNANESSLQAALHYDRLQEFLFYNLPLGRLGEFVVGALVALLYMSGRERVVSSREKWAAHLLLTASLAVILYLMTLDKTTLQVYRYGTFYTLPFGFIIFYLVRYPTRLSRLLSQPAILLLGESSYAFYILHDTILRVFDEGVGRLGATWGEYLAIAAQLLLISLLSILVFSYFESPVRYWLRRSLRPNSNNLRL